MIVCVCNNVSDKEIQERLDEGIPLEEVLIRLHVGEYCKVCLEYISENYKENNEF